MGDGNVHNHKRCPLIVLGGANGQLAGQRASQGAGGHADGERDADRDAQDRADDIEQFGDSTGDVLAVT